jgi:hypothetical protein
MLEARLFRRMIVDGSGVAYNCEQGNVVRKNLNAVSTLL